MLRKTGCKDGLLGQSILKEKKKMNVLVINCGSSSLKYQFINSDTEEVMAKGLCERIGIDGSQITYQPKEGDKDITVTPMPDHTKAVQLVIEKLTDSKIGVVKSLDEIDAVGHRIVHGGEKFASSVVIDDEVIKAITECNDLAPLHNPANLIGIDAVTRLMPKVPQVAVFDTAFHQTMPEKAYLYGLPYEYYEDLKVRRYGFHGTSHDFVSNEAAKFLGKDRKDLKIIVCHLGNGASISAVKNGKSVDTSMGLTPLEGLIMGTRSGDLDPAIVTFLAGKLHISADEVVTILNKKSGVLGLSGISSDFRDLEKAYNEGNERAKITLETYSYHVAKYIGSYVAAMNGVDVIAYTAGVGENTGFIRSMVGEYLTYLGTEIDPEKNKLRGETTIISKPGSKVITMVVPTNEELAICRETVRLTK